MPLRHCHAHITLILQNDTESASNLTLPSSAFQSVSKSSKPFYCSHCQLQAHEKEITELKSLIGALRAELSQLKPTATVSTPPSSSHSSNPPNSTQPSNANKTSVAQSYSSVLQSKGTNVRPNSIHNFSMTDRKFNIVVYGLEECQQGTPRHERMTRDMDSVTSIAKSACPTLTDQSICDCTRLGKYSPDRHRPLLVKFTRSCEAATILANRTKIQAPGIFIKPHLTQQERANENILLKEHRSLINSGITKNNIKIRGNSIYVNNKRHGSATASGFKPCNYPTPAAPNTQSISDLSTAQIDNSNTESNSQSISDLSNTHNDNVNSESNPSNQ